MRAPFQVLALPYRFVDGTVQYCVFHRADLDQWQFISGGGEDDETPEQAVRREIFEETGVNADYIQRLTSMTYIETGIFPEKYRRNWPADLYVLPEYSFGFECTEDPKLSGEHTHFEWLSYEEARRQLTWDSNKTALYELDCRIHQKEKEIEIQGCISVPMGVSIDEVTNKFLEWAESNGWYFGGGFQEIIDGYYINGDGSRGKHVLDED